MNPAIERLVKVLRLESDRGHDNGAVVGGLARMLDPWRGDAESAGVPADLIELVAMRLKDYARLSPASRADTLAGLWHRLGEAYPELGGEEKAAAERGPQAVAQGEEQAADESGSEEQFEAAPSMDAAEAEAEDEPGKGETRAKAEPDKAKTEPESEEPLEPASLQASLRSIPGIGPKSASTLKKLNLETLGDLLWHLPRRYDDYSQLKTINRLWFGEEVTVIGTVEDISVRPVRGGRMKLVEATIGDGTGSIRVTWFNQTWIANRLKPGKPVVLSGRVEQYLGRLTMNSPEWEPLERQQLHTHRIVPVYPLTAGITSKWLRRVIHSTVSRYATRVPDPLPPSVIESAGLIPLSDALYQVHFPDDMDRLKAAQRRLAFDEMLLLQLGVMKQKLGWISVEGQPMPVEDEWIQSFIAALPYELTQAQRAALGHVRQDLAAAQPMNRLLQGDVGSGKTVIAAAAMGIAAANEAQSAILAPTSILAEQHYQTLSELLTQAAKVPPESIRLLLGATPNAEKEEIREGLAEGGISVVVGTHALLEDPVAFSNLGLAIIDEQHRFGVEQRAALRAKGQSPNLMVMTATPIPRSLALTLYGDLDLTVIDEMPPGRKPIETSVMRPVERPRAHHFIRSQLNADHQAFIIYPLVEESEKVAARAAVEEHERLQSEVFPNHKVGLLHGRLRPDEKEEVMARFRAGEYDVLVSTSVVEVGIDVPNATVMLIEGANRFGLSQLHQFRGRVGRGSEESYCLLIPDTEDEADNERLEAMAATNDGFELAEMDLEQRGPGDFLGTRQSGFGELRAARLTDVRLIELARTHATRIFDADPLLESQEHLALSRAVDRFWADGKGEIS